MRGPDTAPQPPPGSERPRKALALLRSPPRSERPGKAVALLDTLIGSCSHARLLHLGRGVKEGFGT